MPWAIASSSVWRSCCASRRAPTTSSPRSASGGAAQDLHARFGGDEFCFLIPDLAEFQQAYAVAERFREAVERFDWTLEDERLAAQPVRVDVGVVCLWLGLVGERRLIARRLAAALIQRADKLMYDAKGERASHIYLMRASVADGALVEMGRRSRNNRGRTPRRHQHCHSHRHRPPPRPPLTIAAC